MSRDNGVTAGAPPVLRTPKPVKSIGRDKARLYCESCGSKRKACRCDEVRRAALEMAQIESRFRLS